MIMRGDAEVLFRALLRAARPARWDWHDAGDGLVQIWGLAATVSSVSAASPEATVDPIRITYNYNRWECSDWGWTVQITPPIPPFFLPNAPDDNKKAKPIQDRRSGGNALSGDGEAASRINRRATGDVDLTESFADYRADYSIADGIVPTPSGA